MSAYCIVDIDVHDPEKMAEYSKVVGAMTARHGGRYLVRSPEVKPLEGGWTPRFLVVIEFPDMPALEGFFASEEYAPLKAIRHAAAHARSVAVEGLAPVVVAA